jgi:hypothetical protein
MKFLNVLLAATSVIATASDGNCYYRSGDIDIIEAAVKGSVGVAGVISGTVGIVGGIVGGATGVAKGAIVGGITLTAAIVVQADAIIHKSCAYGTYYGNSCWRCSEPLPLIAQLDIDASIQAAAGIAVSGH